MQRVVIILTLSSRRHDDATLNLKLFSTLRLLVLFQTNISMFYLHLYPPRLSFCQYSNVFLSPPPFTYLIQTILERNYMRAKSGRHRCAVSPLRRKSTCRDLIQRLVTLSAVVASLVLWREKKIKTI